MKKSLIKSRKKPFFTIIELVIAIGILAIGGTAVLGLFPLGLEQSKDSIGENYCSNAASDIIAYIKTYALADWDNFKISLDENKPGIEEAMTAADIETWTNMLEYGISEDIKNIPTADTGVYGLKKETDNIADFTGVAAIWRGNIGSISNNIAMKVFVEISWPATKTYEHRKKNYYYVELYNYNY
jgi:type II secretory pathway pseudopilin PulG